MLRLLLLAPLVLGEFVDPGLELAKCVDEGNSLDSCTERAFEAIRPIMSTGIPELTPPVLPIDPMFVDKIEFQFVTVGVKFLDVNVRGLQHFEMKSTKVDKEDRTWRVEMSVPRLEIRGDYRMEGEFFGVDLGLSQGPESFNATDVTLTATASLEDRAGKFHASKLDMQFNFEKVRISLVCLFPDQETSSCCPDKWNQSCSPALAKTVHKFFNKDGQKFVQNFLPQISAQIGEIIRNLLNNALQNLESRYMID